MMQDMFEQPMSENGVLLYNYHWTSVQRALQQCCSEIKELGYSKNIQLYLVDDYSDSYSLPEGDLLLFGMFSQSTNEGNISYFFNVGVCSFSDKNNIRHSKMISYLANRFLPGKAMKIINENLEKVGALNFTDQTQVHPMTKDEIRGIQMISVDALSTMKSL